MNTINYQLIESLSISNMDNISLNPEIVKDLSMALLHSVTNNTQEEINRNSSIIYSYQKQEYYAAYLLEIINTNLGLVDNQPNEILVSSAFSQLKVMVRSYWYDGGNSHISQTNKFCLMSSIVRTSFNISSIKNHTLLYKYLKLLKDIISTSCQDAIDIYPQVCKSIQLSLDQPTIIHLLPVYLNILLGISSYGKQVYNQKYKQMIKTVHPLLYRFVNNGNQTIQELYRQLQDSANQNRQFLNKYLQYKRKYQQILYQSIKLMHKAICHSCSNQLRPSLLSWISIALNRIQYIDNNFTIRIDQQRQGFVFNRNNIGHKGNDEFNYFHGKKWALKFINTAMRNLLILRQGNNQQNKSTINFYQKNFQYLVTIFSTVWSYRWPDRIHKELLKCLQIFICSKPRDLAQRHQSLLIYYQATMLPPLMLITQRQLQILQQNPIEFISLQANICNKQSIRMIAATIWTDIATIQYSFNPEANQSKYLHHSFTLIKSWIQILDESNLQIRENGCFLLLKLKEPFVKQQGIREALHLLVNKVIRDNLTYCSNKFCFIVLTQLLELFTAYKTILFPQIIEDCKIVILDCFNKYNSSIELVGQQTLIMFYCCKAFCRLIKGRRESLEQVGFQNIKIVIYKALLLVQKTSYQQFINEVVKILQICVREISDCAKDIACFIHNWFRNYSQKDIFSFKNDNARQYNRSYIQIAKGTLSIFKILIYFVRNGHQEITNIIENEIISIIYYLFSRENTNEIDNEIIEEAIWLLKYFLENIKDRSRISSQVLNTCRLIIIKLAGLSSTAISSIRSRIQNEKGQQKRKYLIYLNSSQAIQQGFQEYVGVIRNFIRFITFGESIKKEIKILSNQNNCTQTLMYLPIRFFRNELKSDVYKPGKCFSLLMLIYYYQHHQQPNNTVRVHSTVNAFTLLIIKQALYLCQTQPLFAKYNVQLFSLWLYEAKDDLQAYFQNWSLKEITHFFNYIFVYKHDNDNYYGLQQINTLKQQIRCILGISYFLKLITQQKMLDQLIPFQLLTTVISHAVNFIIRRINEQDQTLLEEKEQQQEELDQQVRVYANLMEKQLGEAIQMDQLDMGTQDGRNNESQWVSQSDESDEQDYDENCIQFQQFEDEESYSSLDNQNRNQRLQLLFSLYEFKQFDELRYWKIVSQEELNGSLYRILLDCQCIKNNSPHSYLQDICVISEEEQDIQND